MNKSPPESESQMNRVAMREVLSCVVGVSIVITLSAGVDSDKPKTGVSDDGILIRTSVSATVEPRDLAITFGKTYGREFGILVSDLRSTNKFVCACVAQAPSTTGEMVKYYAGVPFALQSLQADTSVTLTEPSRIAISKNRRQLMWADTTSARSAGKNHIDGEPGDPKLNGLALVAVGTSFADWGLERKSSGLNLSVTERHLKELKKVAEYPIDGVIVPSPASEIPFLCDKQGFASQPVPNAVGVSWHFEEASIAINVGGDKYESQKAGASIEFTKDGPVLRDVKKVDTRR